MYNADVKRNINVIGFPKPFVRDGIKLAVAPGSTVREIVNCVIDDPELTPYTVVHIGPDQVPMELWDKVRPKVGTDIVVNVVPKGGGIGRLLAMVAITALAVVATVFGGPIAGMLVMTLGTTLLNIFMPPPGPEIAKNQGQSKPSYVINGARNRADVYGKLPFVAGTFRVTPPYAAMPVRELAGSDHYFRCIFAIGHGPLQFDDFKIGETSLSNLSDVELEYRRGYWSFNHKGNWSFPGGAFPANPQFGDTYQITVNTTVQGVAFKAGQSMTFSNLAHYTSVYAWDINQDRPFSLYPEDIYEEALNVELTQADGPQVRTSRDGAHELSIDVMFERLFHSENSPPGKRSNGHVELRIEQSRVGKNEWVLVKQHLVVANSTVPIYWGHRWTPASHGPVDTDGKYDVRITRLSRDFDESRDFGKSNWVALRTITTDAPVPDQKAALIAIRIRASGQLQGVIDEFNCKAHTIARTWDASSNSWQWGVTNNPAALCRHIVQYPTRWAPLRDDQIDLPRLQYWSTVCQSKQQFFNGVFESKQSLYDAIVSIARVGRASPTLRDMRFSVIIDEPKSTPVRIFTPRNSWGYEGELSYEPTPHAYRCGYSNADQSYSMDEVVVYDDGYNANNATRIERIDWIGITNYQQVYRETRYHIAQQRLRREVHHITTDMENLQCERGDLIGLQHDVIAVGLGNGRIVSLVTAGSTVNGVVVDTPVVMETGTQYAIRVAQLINGKEITKLYRIHGGQGEFSTLLFQHVEPEATAPLVGDLFSFGIADREILPVIVRDIEPMENLQAKLTLIAEAKGVHTAELGTIPPYDPIITVARGLTAPDVISILSDSTVMLVTPNRTLIPRVVFNLRSVVLPEGTVTYVQYKRTGTNESWETAATSEETNSSISITGVQSGQTYDFRITRSNPNYLSSPTTNINAYTVVGRFDPPRSMQNLHLEIAGGQALLRWDTPIDVDVQVGGWIVFRHSPAMTGAVWSNSYSIGKTVNGDQVHVWLPLKPGTYMAKIYDSDGRESPTFASVTTTQDSVHNFVNVATLEEGPDFTGNKLNMAVESEELYLMATDFDTSPDIDSVENFDMLGLAVSSSGTYEFGVGFDFGTIRRVRLTSMIDFYAVNLYSTVDARGDIDSWPDIDGTYGAPVDVQIWARVTDQDPDSPNVEWGPFLRVDTCEVACRGVGHVEARVTTDDPTYTVRITSLGLRADGVA